MSFLIYFWPSNKWMTNEYDCGSVVGVTEKVLENANPLLATFHYCPRCIDTLISFAPLLLPLWFNVSFIMQILYCTFNTQNKPLPLQIEWSTNVNNMKTGFCTRG